MPIYNPSGKRIVTGSYVGDNGDDRQIVTGFKCSAVIIFSGGVSAILVPGIAIMISNGAERTGGTALHATDGFVVYQTADSLNQGAVTYHYWAIST